MRENKEEGQDSVQPERTILCHYKDSQAQEVTGMEAPVPANFQVYWRVDTPGDPGWPWDWTLSGPRGTLAL